MGGPNANGDTPAAELRPLPYSDIPGWRDDDHAAALTAFRRAADALAESPPKRRGLNLDADALTAAIRDAALLPATVSADDARAFFESRFIPHAVMPADGGSAFFTGYYEPEVAGSRERTQRFTVPLHAPPVDLVEIEPGTAPGIDATFRFARTTPAGLVALPDRGAIMAGALSGTAPAVAWVADPVDAFFIHIQGAARIRLPDGGFLRVTYAAKSGHPYTPIGRVLIQRGALPSGGATMQTIRAWLAAHPESVPEILATNRSYIFFREAPVDDRDLGPIAAAKVPLTAGRSIAVDRLLHTFHAPVWIDTTLPGGAPYRRLMTAQDTGSAIIGPARGDIFFGSGDAAGEIAGGMAARGQFILLLPGSAR